MTRDAILIDSGALDQIVGDTRTRAIYDELRSRGFLPEIPTVVLAEGITGTRRDASINQVIRALGTRNTDERTAHRAGNLRHQVDVGPKRRRPSGIDAIVAAHAASFDSSIILTTDPRDLGKLADYLPNVTIIPVG